MASGETRPLALVTGGSSGIGYELARQFAMNGYDVVIAADGAEKLQEAKARLASEFAQARVDAVEADLSRREGVERVHRFVRESGRPLDALAANAGAGVAGDFAATDLEAELGIINLNVLNQVHLIKLVLRDMLEQGGGKVLITSSLVSLTPGPYMAVYAASKAFLRSFGLAIRNELKDNPVTVTVLMPGATDTDFFEKADMEDTSVAQGSKDDPADVAKEAFEALMSESSQVVTGTANKVRAGMTHLAPDTTLAQMNRGQARPAR